MRRVKKLIHPDIAIFLHINIPQYDDAQSFRVLTSIYINVPNNRWFPAIWH